MLNINNKNYRYRIIEFDKYAKYAYDKYDWVKSIIVFVIPYINRIMITNKNNNYFLPAKFALGKDYHKIIHDNLSEIALINDLGRYEVLCDVSFLNERKLCEDVGLGVIAKNGLLMTPEFGTRVLIGEILTSRKLENYITTNDYTSLCTNCNTCVNICPTNAIDNKNNCLSLLSQINSKEDYEKYDKFTCYYGCDVCQDVCPINIKLDKYDIEKEFEFNEDSLINYDKIKDLSNKKFLKEYENKNFNWIGYTKILRNIVVLEVNNNNISIDEIEKLQSKYINTEWFSKHLEYLKGKKKNGIN